MSESTLTAKTSRLSTMVPGITAGIVIGFTEVIFATSLATLIFAGSLQAYLPRGIAIALVTSTISIFFLAVYSNFEEVISGIQDNPAVLTSVAVASVAGVIGAGPELMPTVIALILVMTLVTGIVLFLIGYFGLGGLMRYIPFPVIGGFLAGTGWLLAQGSIGAMADYPLSIETLPNLAQVDQIVLWLPGVAFGLILFFGVRRFKHFLVLPGIIIGALLLFLLVVLLSGMTFEQAMERGLLLGHIGGDAVWQPLPIQDLAKADWGVVLAQAGHIGTIVVISAVTLLLDISGLELALRKDVELNHELRIAGVTNILSALAGGMIAFQDLSYTLLNHQIGARGRLAGFIAGGSCLMMFVIGLSLLAYVPKSLLGGLLLFMGLTFLDEWIVEARHKLGRADYLVILLMLFIIAVSNFLVGVSIGLFLMVIIFVLNYSRINIFHHTLTGSEVKSNVERNSYHQRELVKMGKQIFILKLQGFIFFGTANVVLDEIRQRLSDTNEGPLLFLVLDFRRVTGLDSSAVFSLTKVKYLADKHNFRLVFTDMSDENRHELIRGGLEIDDRMQFFADLDHGLEWCEEELLLEHQVTTKRVAMSLDAQLSYVGFKKEDTAKLKLYLQKIQLAQGEYLIHQGEPFSDLYFIELGQVSVYLELGNDKRVRIQTPSTGTIVGELGFYLDVPRSASVVAEVRTIAYKLTREAMQDMKAKDPELAIAFNELMLQVIAERLVTTNRELMALNR